MIVQVEKFMRKWNMVPEGGRVLVGVSGGADSVCLCLILYELSTKMNFSLEVIHVEHGIRGEESKNDAVFVEQLCKQRGLSVISGMLMFHVMPKYIIWEKKRRHEFCDIRCLRMRPGRTETSGSQRRIIWKTMRRPCCFS